MSYEGFAPHELFVYVNGGKWELGEVKRRLDDETYACWYSTGDTAARTHARNMRKLANAGWSHVERDGEDGLCEWELVHSGAMYDVYRCSKCLYEHAESRTDGNATELDPSYCPNCGRRAR